MKDQAAIDLALDKQNEAPSPISPTSLMKHGVILAQSGSGKSFMLGRLVEEIVLKTKARVIIFDPNSDFIRFSEPDPNVWSKDFLKKWFYPAESQKKFKRLWTSMPLVTGTNRNLPNVRPLVLDWGRLGSYEMSSIMNIDIKHESDLYWCTVLAWQLSQDTWENEDEAFFDFDHFREQSERVVNFITTGEGSALLEENPLAEILHKELPTQLALRFMAIIESMGEYQIWRSRGDREVDIMEFIQGADAPRVLVIDLESLEKEDERIVIAKSILSALWSLRRLERWEAMRDFDRLDERVPTFVVVDEAHNLIPEVKDTAGLRDLSSQFVRIAAEGRKYGIYLLVATQRPRKLDSNILTECDNLFLMRMTSDSDLTYLSKVLGFTDLTVLKEAKSFSVGELQLSGSVGGSNAILHVSPRRTKEGGRGISKTYWLERD